MILFIWNIIMSLAVEVRRLRNVGYSGWWVLVIRFLGSVVNFLVYGKMTNNRFINILSFL
ncbi:MAG: hypothetical protein DI619_00380 [Francisella sp.]|nr:MAG: hypothetical protein DI619_00380 [Francisella sp.]